MSMWYCRTHGFTGPRACCSEAGRATIAKADEPGERTTIREQIRAIPADVEDERIVAVYAPAALWRSFAFEAPSSPS